MHITRTLAAAVAAAALPLAAAGAASAGTATHHPMFLHASPLATHSTRVYAVGSAGYVATGAQFRRVTETAYLRNPAQYASITDGIGFGVTLQSAAWQIDIGVSDTTTSGTIYSPGVDEYQNGTLKPGAPDYAAQWCPAGGACQPAADGGGFAVGDTVTETVTYSQSSGVVNYSAHDAAGNLFTGQFRVGAVSFTQADVGAGFGSFTAPPSAAKLVAFSKVALTTYSGKTTGLSSWWSHAKELATSDGTSTGAVQAAPTDLGTGGSSFSVNFAAAG